MSVNAPEADGFTFNTAFLKFDPWYKQEEILKKKIEKSTMNAFKNQMTYQRKHPEAQQSNTNVDSDGEPIEPAPHKSEVENTDGKPSNNNSNGKSTGVNPIQLTPEQQKELKTKVEYKMKTIKKDRLLGNDVLRMDNLIASLRKARKTDDQLAQFDLSSKKIPKPTAHKETTQVITQIS